jgi:arabinofuranosyltransferase
MTVISPARREPGVHRRWRDVVPLASLIAIFTYVFVTNSWVSDDAYISFRVVDNVIHGYGLTYNPPERVQAYTHPLWLLLHIPAYLVTGDVFYATLTLSFAASVAALLVAVRALSRWTAILVALLLFSSKAFIDYTSSGLENPLSYLLLAVFLTRLFSEVNRGRESVTVKEVTWYTAVASLAFVNRIDSILLYAPVLVWLWTKSFAAVRWRALRGIAVGLSPAIAWELFSLIYYGFALPNTFYAKIATGIPESLLFRQGVVYVLNSIAHDGVTLSIIAIAVAISWASRHRPLIAVGVGLFLTVTYTIWVGGDHMGGRFFAVPYFGAAVLVGSHIRHRGTIAAWVVVLVAYNLAAPLAPLKSGPSYQQGWAWRDTNGVQDERGYYHRATNLLLYNPLRERPDHEWYRQGLSFAAGPERVSVLGSIGFFGYTAGPAKFIIDTNALSDPLLARLPVTDQLYFEFYVGHYRRELPAGYVESIRQGRNLLQDPQLHEFYNRLLNITHGPLFSLARLQDIWSFNVGRYRNFSREYAARQVMRVSVPAASNRFETDTGERDTDRLDLHTRGHRAGYVQYGGKIPMRSGSYVVRWVGRYDDRPPFDETGRAEIWVDGGRRQQVMMQAHEAGTGSRLLAEMRFDLEQRTTNAEFRLYLHEGVTATLERLEIVSAGAEIESDDQRTR